MPDITISEGLYKLFTKSVVGMFFEYDTVTDTIELYRNYSGAEGSPFIKIKDYTKLILSGSYIPDEYKKQYIKFLRSRSDGEIEFKRRNSGNNMPYKDEFIWYRMTGVSDMSRGHLCKLGQTECIQNEKIAELKREKRGFFDIDTGLLTRVYADEMIDEYLTSSKGSSNNTLIMFDLDGFTDINDAYGVKFADAVLADVADAMRDAFPNDSIMGRCGGDEFEVLVKGRDADETIRFADDFSKRLGTIYTGENRKYKLSASIALVDTHTSWDYFTLYDHANRVVSYIKSCGGAMVKSYRMANTELGEQVNYVFPRRIGSTSVMDKRTVSPDNLLEYAMTLMEDTRDASSSINILLSRIGKRYCADRVIITSVGWETLDFRFAYMWDRSGKSSVNDYGSKITIRNYYLMASGYDERGLREGAGDSEHALGSSIEAAIYNKGTYSGALRVEVAKKDHRWNDELRSNLSLLANLFGTYLSRETGEKRLRLKEFEMDVMATAIKGGMKIVLDDRDRTILNVSDGLCEMLGYTREEFFGITDGIEENLIYPEDRETVRNETGTELLHDVESYTLKYRVKCKDGSLKWILDYGRRVKDAQGRSVFYTTCTDVTEMEKSTEQIRELYNQSKAVEKFIRIALRNTKTSEFSYYPYERRCSIPERSCDILGSKPEYTDMPYDFVDDIVDEEMRHDVIGVFNSISIDKPTVSCEFKAKNSDRWIRITLSAIKDEKKDDFVGIVVGIAEDISDETFEAQERMRIIDSISESYFAMYHIRLNEGMYTALSQEDDMDAVIASHGDLNTLRDKLIMNFVDGDFCEACASFFSSEYARIVLNENHRVENFEYKYKKDGELIWVRASIMLVSMKDGEVESYMLAFTDINEEKLLQEEQRKEHRILSLAISDSYEKIYEIGLRSAASYEVRIVNDYAERRKMAYDHIEMIDYMTDNFVHPDDRDYYRERLALDYLRENITEDKPPVYMEFRLDESGSGEYRWKSYIIKGVPGDDESAMLFRSDITERKLRELETNAVLKDAFDMATSANNAKSDFLSKMSHDIRTPMNAIIGMTAIAGAHIDEKERVKDCLAKIDISSKHLLSLINEVLDMSKIESGKMSLNEDNVNISDLVDGLVTMLRPAMEKKRQKFSVTIKDFVHEDVRGDALRIQQVFVNLLSNAMKYTPEEGSIELKIRERKSQYKGLAHYEFIFKDNGIGMTPEFQKKIFEPFSREEDSRTSKIQGTGLGMAITKQIVNMMNGDIEVRSELNKGSEFIVDILLKLQDRDYAERDMLEGLLVLVIDDDESSLEGTCATLEAMNMKPIPATGCDRAVSIAKKLVADGDRLFCVLTDELMPDKDGIETSVQLRRIIGNDIPIIMASGFDWADIETQARAAGVNSFVSKPLFRSRLVPLFMEYIGVEDEDETLVSVMESSDFTGHRMLLVEDNEINMEIALEILSYTNVEIDTAENGKIAFEKVRDHEPNYYELVLMDVQMPIMNGYEATRAIRALDRPDAKELPIIACTVNAFVEDVNNAKEAGMTGHISKPIDFEELMRTMNKWLR